MALTVFPAEMYKDDLYRVVHSQEEAIEANRFGWLDQMPVDRERSSYTSLTAAKPKAALKPVVPSKAVDPAKPKD